MTKNLTSRPENSRDVQRGSGDLQADSATETGLVSVVIPCYNQAHFLSEAIESVLAQTYQNFEIIVVDDGSADNTSEVAASYPNVRCIRQDNQGLSGARNTGIRSSRGEYLVFLDADDRLVPEALEVGLECLKDHPECALASGYWRPLAADGSPLPLPRWGRPVVKSNAYVALLQRNYIGMPAAAMHRRFVFEAGGSFDTSLRACEDYDLYLRIARKFPVYYHDEIVAEYRKHGTNMSDNHALMLAASVSVLRSQREHIKGNRQYEEAYGAGLRYEQWQWGVPLADRVRAHLQGGEWKQALRGIWALLRYYPQGLTLVVNERRKLTRQLQARDKRLQEVNRALREERQRARRLAEQNQRLTLRVQGLQRQLQEIQESETWKLLKTVSNIRAKLPRR